MEIGDIYLVNKSDLPGADAMVINLLSVVREMKGKSRPVLKVSALKGEGIDPAYDAVEEIRARFLSPEGEAMRLRSTRGMIVELARRKLLSDLEGTASTRSAGLAEMVARREITFNQAAERLADSQRRYGGAPGHGER
jgi:LAO/AO transport system kinase